MDLHTIKVTVAFIHLQQLKNKNTNDFTTTARDLDIFSKSMVSSSDDNTVKLWDCDSGQCIHTFTTHTDEVR